MLLYITPFNQHWHHRNIGITGQEKTTQSGWIEINYYQKHKLYNSYIFGMWSSTFRITYTPVNIVKERKPI